MLEQQIEDESPLEISDGEYGYITRIEEEKSKRILCLYEEISSKTVLMVKLDYPKPFPQKLINQCRFLKSLQTLPSRFPKYITHGQ